MAGDEDSADNDNPPSWLAVITSDVVMNDEAPADPKIIGDGKNADDDEDPDLYVFAAWRSPRGKHSDDSSDDSDNEMGDIEMSKISHRKWVAKDNVRRLIADNFRDFLLTFVNPFRKNGHGKPVYPRKINDMVSLNKCSLEIKYNQLMWNHSILGYWLVKGPQPVLEIMEEVAGKIIDEMHPDYRRTHEKIYLRISNLRELEPIREIRHIHWNTLIRTAGIVTRRSRVLKQLMQVIRNCEKCGATSGPFPQNSDSDSEIKGGPCPECQSLVFSINMEQTTYRKYQTLILQESFRAVPDGLNPRCKEVLLFNELIDCAKPGDEIDVTGVYTYTSVSDFESMIQKDNGRPYYPPMIEANYVNVTKNKDPYVQLNSVESGWAHLSA